MIPVATYTWMIYTRPDVYSQVRHMHAIIPDTVCTSSWHACKHFAHDRVCWALLAFLLPQIAEEIRRQEEAEKAKRGGAGLAKA